ncbi:hypothetical protein D3C72_808870 [compost metagenome]
MSGEGAAQGHSQHRSEWAAGNERGAQAGAQAAGEYRQHHGNAHAAIGSFADSHAQPGDEHFAEVRRHCTAECSEAPQAGHQHEALDPAPAVGEDRQRQCQDPHHQRNNAAERAQFRISQRPFVLQQRKYRIEHLARHVV